MSLQHNLPATPTSSQPHPPPHQSCCEGASEAAASGSFGESRTRPEQQQTQREGHETASLPRYHNNRSRNGVLYESEEGLHGEQQCGAATRLQDEAIGRDKHAAFAALQEEEGGREEGREEGGRGDREG